MPRAALFLLLVLSPKAFAGLDVVFLLDTTGSMGGELGEVKDRVRQLAEVLRTQRENERVRFGVVAYRDQGDAYVTKTSPLDTDADVSFRFLAGLTADGGGDGPEDVLAGLTTALRDLNWDGGDDVEREVFLIGDAPPHLDYSKHLTPEEVIHEARHRRIVVHALGCRSLPSDGVAFFQTIAYGTEGSYQHVGQVRTGGTSGVTGALMNALKRPNGKVGQLSGDSVGVRLTAHTLDVEGLTTTPVVAEGGLCAVRVSLPEGLSLSGAPGGATAGHELELSARVEPGSGGTWVVALEHCLPSSTRVRLALHN